MVGARTLAPRGLLELDPDLGAMLSPARVRAARDELRPPVLELRPGRWEPSWPAAPGHLGLLVLDGVLSRDLLAGEVVSPELLGPGDVARPWEPEAAASLFALEVRWNVLSEARVAVLDLGLGALTRYPEVATALAERLEARAQRMATMQAIGRLGRVDERLVALFWHLGDRWGRVSPEGVVIPLTLSHRLLGQLVGARRPTVSAALGRLADADRIVRRGDGAWLLRGVPAGLAEAKPQVAPRRQLLLERGPETLPVRSRTPAASARAESGTGRHSMEEMTEAIARLRLETAERAQALQNVVEVSAELCRTTGIIRRRRHGARSAA